MTRRAMDEAIADYAEKTRGEFKVNQLRRFVATVVKSHRSPRGRYFDEGDVVVTLVDDEGVFMKDVRILSRFGVGTVRRARLIMSTEVVSDAADS